MLRICALYLSPQTLLCRCIFALVMANSCKRYFNSFFDTLVMHIVSAVSPQIMSDHGRKQQENERFSVGICAPHRLNWGLELNVCVVQSIELFQCFTSFTTSENRNFLFCSFQLSLIPFVLYFVSLSPHRELGLHFIFSVFSSSP